MVIWTRNRLDDFGQYIKDLVASELKAMGKPASDFWSIAQKNKNLSPGVVIETRQGLAEFSVEYHHETRKTPETELRALIRDRLVAAYNAAG